MDLQTFFSQNNRLAVAFSGGTDSAFLLWAAKHYGAFVTAYYLKTQFQPEFELADALSFAETYGIELKVLHSDILSCPVVKANPADRCYHCKNEIFSRIKAEAEKDGFTLIADGTNASDDETDRPGMRALREMGIVSPLRECGITKAEVRRLSREAGLFTGDKPSYACLATRIPTGEEITAEKLAVTEKTEGYMMSLGFSDFRIRQKNGSALIQIKENQFPLFSEKKEKILAELSHYYKSIYPEAEIRK